MKGFASGALAAALTLMTSHAMAATGYGTAGCGLGSIVFGAKPGMIQVLAATTNGTFGSQTFGITSGTSNCEKGGGDMEDGGDMEKPHKKHKKKNTGSIQEQTDFIANNLNSLKRDAAQGYGDSLAALASTLGCEVGVYPQFTQRLQAAQAQIFATNDASKILAGIKSQVQSQPALNEACDVGASDLAQSH